MKKYKKVDANEWVSIVNREASPTLTDYSLNYLQLGDEYAVHIYSGYGSLLSPLTKDEKVLDTFEKELKLKHDALKGIVSSVGPRQPGAPGITTF